MTVYLVPTVTPEMIATAFDWWGGEYLVDDEEEVEHGKRVLMRAGQVRQYLQPDDPSLQQFWPFLPLIEDERGIQVNLYSAEQALSFVKYDDGGQSDFAVFWKDLCDELSHDFGDSLKNTLHEMSEGSASTEHILWVHRTLTGCTECGRKRTVLTEAGPMITVMTIKHLPYEVPITLTIPAGGDHQDVHLTLEEANHLIMVLSEAVAVGGTTHDHD